MPKEAPTTLKQLVQAYGRSEKYWSGFIDGMGLSVSTGPKNAKQVSAAGAARIAARIEAMRGRAGP